MADIQTKPEPRCPICGATMMQALKGMPEDKVHISWACSRWPTCLGALPVGKDEAAGKLRLDLDDLYTEGYYYTSFDIGGAGHSIVIEAKDRDAFLDEFARIWRERAAEALIVADDEEGK